MSEPTVISIPPGAASEARRLIREADEARSRAATAEAILRAFLEGICRALELEPNRLTAVDPEERTLTFQPPEEPRLVNDVPGPADTENPNTPEPDWAPETHQPS